MCIARMYETKVSLTFHRNGDVTTSYNLCGQRYRYSALCGEYFLEKDTGEVLYCYGKIGRDKFILKQCD